VLRPRTLEIDLEICLPKPFTTEAIPAFAAAAPFIAQLRQSLLARRWPEVRAVIKADFLDQHVQRLAHKLDAADPGLVSFLDAHVDAVRTASRVLPGFAARVYAASGPYDGYSYLYWKYSRDVLGKKVGLTYTALRRQLGERDLAAPVQFRFPCPNCGADAECEADGVGESVPDHLRMQCRACGHVDYHSKYGDAAVASHVLCGCSCCVAETRRSGAGLELLQWDLAPALVRHVRTEIAALAARRAVPGQVDERAEAVVRAFAAQWAAGSEGSFEDAVRAWIERRQPRLFHLCGCLEQAWTLIDALADAGAVSITVEGEADDDQHVVEDLVLDNEARFTRKDEQQQQRAEQEQASAVTRVLMGFELDKPGSLADWLRVVSQVGLFDHWFTLPCDILCRLDPERLASFGKATWAPPAPRATAPAPAPALQAAIALLRAHGYRVHAPK
jgi:hypothetical protein